MSRSIAATLGGQNDVIATLERLIGELSGKADARRFARLIAELREDQIAHEKSSRAEIGVATLPLEINELSRAQRANLNKAVAGTDFIGEDLPAHESMDDKFRAAELFRDEEEVRMPILVDDLRGSVPVRLWMRSREPRVGAGNQEKQRNDHIGPTRDISIWRGSSVSELMWLRGFRSQ
jgi:hypothetical protein